MSCIENEYPITNEDRDSTLRMLPTVFGTNAVNSLKEGENVSNNFA